MFDGALMECELPEKTSDCLLLALEDLDKVAAMTYKYKIDMFEYVKQLDHSPQCLVCLAGSTMVMRLGASITGCRSPVDYDRHTMLKLINISNVALGIEDSGSVGADYKRVHRAVSKHRKAFVMYSSNPVKWREYVHKVIAELQAMGD